MITSDSSARRRVCRTRLRTAAVLLGLVLPAALPLPAAARTFAGILGTPITQPISRALALSIGRALPVLSASPGVIYVADPETGTFERETVILGQLFLERADTIGRRRWNVSLSYQWVRIDTLDGDPLDHLRDTRFPIIDPRNGRAFTIPTFGITLETHEATASVTYGLTDDLDLNVTVPLLESDFGLRVAVRDQDTGDVQRDAANASAFGVGDVFVRGKYHLVHGGRADVALGLVLRLPSGDQDNFQGTGAVEVAPLLYASTPALRPVAWLALQPYANAGANLTADDVAQSEGRWGVGLDCRLAERASVAVAVLGRHPFDRPAPAGFFDVQRLDPVTGRRFTAPLLGIRGDRPDFYNLSVGGRINLWRDTLFGLVNVFVPLNRDGFRSDVIPLAGLETTF